MKSILLWDPRFPDRRPARLTVDDTVASAAVRAGVAAAANPAEAGSLAAGAAIEPSMLTEVLLQHGLGGDTRRVFLPVSVAVIGALAGVLTAVGTPTSGSVTPTPPPTPAPTLTQPGISPAAGTVGQTFTATDGMVTNGTLTGRRWLLGGTAIGTGTTVTPNTVGTLTLENTATGTNGAVITNTAAGVAISAVTPTPTPTPTGPITIAMAGSSSPLQYLNSYTGGTSNANVTSGSGTSQTQMTKGRMGMELGTALYNATGRPVRFIDTGASGSQLSEWEAAGNGSRAYLVNQLIASTNAGFPVTACLLQVGFNDASYGNIPNSSTAQQAALLRSLISKIRSESGLPNLVIFLGATQDVASQKNPLRWLREAEMQIANNDTNVRFGFSTYDLPTTDGTHQTEPSQIITAGRFAAQSLALIKGTAQKRAAFFSGTSAVSDTQTDAIITHKDGTDFTPTTGITGFRVFDSAGNELAVTSAARQSANSVRVTHASKAGGTGSLIYIANPPQGQAPESDNATVLHDNSPLTLPFDVTSSGLAIAAVGTVPGDTTAPIITSAAAFNQPENAALSTTLAANETVTWSKVGGADAAKFTLSGATLSLPAQDYETPTDADANRSYIVTVRATDTAGNFTDQTITVTITDVSEGTPTFVATGKEAYFDAADVNAATASGWNAWAWLQGSGKLADTALNTPAGAATGWTARMPTPNGAGIQGAGGATTGGNSGVYPDAVLAGYYFTATTTPTGCVIDGLDPTKYYSIELLGSRTSADRYTKFRVKPGTADEQTINHPCSNNTSIVALFTPVAPVSGAVAFDMSVGTIPAGGNSGFMYFNGGKIREYTLA